MRAVRYTWTQNVAPTASSAWLGSNEHNQFTRDMDQKFEGR